MEIICLHKYFLSRTIFPMAALTEGIQSPESLTILSEQLASHARDLLSAAEGLKSLKLPELLITHDNSREIGWKGVDAYMGAVKNAVREAGTKRVPSGDTGTDGKGLNGRQRVRKPRKGDTGKKT